MSLQILHQDNLLRREVEHVPESNAVTISRLDMHQHRLGEDKIRLCHVDRVRQREVNRAGSGRERRITTPKDTKLAFGPINTSEFYFRENHGEVMKVIPASRMFAGSSNWIVSYNSL